VKNRISTLPDEKLVISIEVSIKRVPYDGTALDFNRTRNVVSAVIPAGIIPDPNDVAQHEAEWTGIIHDLANSLVLDDFVGVLQDLLKHGGDHFRPMAPMRKYFEQ